MFGTRERCAPVMVLTLVLGAAACASSSGSTDSPAVPGNAPTTLDEVVVDDASDEATSTTDAPDVTTPDTETTVLVEVDSPSDSGPGSDEETDGGGEPADGADTPIVTEVPAISAPVTPPSPAADGITVVYGGSGTNGNPWAPLGWWDGAAWIPAGFSDDGSFIVPPPPSFSGLAATSLDLPDGESAVEEGLTFGASKFYCVGDEVGPVIDLASDIPNTPVSLGYDAIAVTADWPLQPRSVAQIGLENPEYAEVGAALFSDVGTADEGDVVQVVRVDLDGNGIEEVLVTYERITDTSFGAQDDFTGVYLRSPAADGTVVDELVAGFVLGDPTDFPTIGRYTIAAVGDLNGDGVMEVAIRNQFWESAGITVFAFEDGELRQLFGGGCGV